MTPLIDAWWIDWNLSCPIPITEHNPFVHSLWPCAMLRTSSMSSHQDPSYGRQYQTCLRPYLMASANRYQSKIILSCSCLFFLSNPAKYFETSARTLSSSFNMFRQLQLIFLHDTFACASSNSSKKRKSSLLVSFFLQICSSLTSEYFPLPRLCPLYTEFLLRCHL